MKAILKYIVILLVFSIAQAQSIKFKVTLGGHSHEEGRCAVQLYDKGYVVVGSTSSYGAGSTDVYLIRTDSLGNPKFYKTIGGSGVDYAYSVVVTPDTSFVICGYSNSYSSSYDYFLVKTDKDGNVKWTKNYGGGDWDFGYKVVVTKDGGMLIVGGTYSYGKGDEDVYLIKTDSNGDTLWTKTYGGLDEDYGKGVKQLADTGFIIVGSTKSFGDINGDVYALRLKANGDTVWTRRFGGSNYDYANDVLDVPSSSSFILGGNTLSGVTGEAEYLLGISYAGNFIWEQKYKFNNASTLGDGLEALCHTADSNFAFVGYTETGGGGRHDMRVMKFDKSGYYISGTTYGTFEEDYGYSIASTSDKGFIMCGTTDSTAKGFGLPNIFLVKADSNLATAKKFYLVGLNELASGPKSVCIYPNPAKDRITVASHAYKTMYDQYTVSLFDLQGKELYRSVSNASSLTIDRDQAWVKGIYLLLITTTEGVESFKLELE